LVDCSLEYKRSWKNSDLSQKPNKRFINGAALPFSPDWPFLEINL
jgi:hypothetical protein